MVRALDGDALLSYCRRLDFDTSTRETLRHMRNSPPSRAPKARQGNVAVWCPSRKMGGVIKAETCTVEFAYVLQCEHDLDVLELYDQPPSIELRYRDRLGCVQTVTHTPDYFVFRYGSAGWIECKSAAELQRLAAKRPHRYQLDGAGRWRCPPGEIYASQYGLHYDVYSSEAINWNAQANWLFLEEYYQDLDKSVVPERELNLLTQLVTEAPGINLSALATRAQSVSRDHIYIAIARGDLFVDLTRYCLSDQSRAYIPVYRDQDSAIT